MKRLIIPAAVAALISTSFATRDADASVATSIGTKVAEKIVVAIAGKGAEEVIGLIFGSGPDPLTIDQVKDAIDSAFEAAEIKDLTGEHNGLANKIDDYRGDRSNALDLAQDIVDRTGDLQGNIDSHINKQNSIRTVPLYISVTNSRLAFAAERYRLEKIASNRDAVAEAALAGLHALQHYLETEFSDPKRGNSPCVAKDASTKLNINGADGTNWTEKAVNVSTWYCYGNGRVIKAGVFNHVFGHDISSKKEAEAVRVMLSDRAVVNLGGAYYMRNTDLGRTQNSGLYMFARRMDNHGKKYFLEVTPSKTFADMLRNHYFVKYYPRELGDLHSQILGWIDIIKATGNAGQLSEALTIATYLGIGWNTLETRYKNHGHTNFVNHNLVGLFKHHGEHRRIED